MGDMISIRVPDTIPPSLALEAVIMAELEAREDQSAVVEGEPFPATIHPLALCPITETRVLLFPVEEARAVFRRVRTPPLSRRAIMGAKDMATPGAVREVAAH